MIKFAINKLIRDKIPALGGHWELKVLDEAQYNTALIDKLDEEIAEFKSAATITNMIEEMADVLEVIEAIARLNGFTIEEILRAKALKKDSKGGFNKEFFGVSLSD